MTASQRPPGPSWPGRALTRFWRKVCNPRTRHPASLYWYMKKADGMDNFMKDNPSKQWFSHDVHHDYCRWKQNHYYAMFDAYRAGRPCRKRLMTAMPRGWLKTRINVGSKMWAQLENPEFATYIGSSDDDLAITMLSSVRPIYQGHDGYAQFHILFGTGWYDPSRKDAKDEIVHGARRNLGRKEPSFKIFSIKTGFKGHHPDLSELDDPTDRERLTKEGSAHLEAGRVAVAAARPAMPECSVQEVTMTRYHDDDPQGHYQRLEGVKSWSGHPPWDPEVTISSKGEWDVYHLQARDPETGESVLPQINTTEDLDKYEASKPQEFWNQMMNQPARGDHMGLDFKVLQDEIYIPPEKAAEIPGDFIVVVDTAFKDPKKMADGCESVFEIFKADSRPTHADYIYYEGYGSRKDRIEDFTERLVLKIQEYHQKRRHIYLITDERSPGKAGAWFHYLMSICHSKGIPCPPTKELVRGGGKESKKIQRIRVAAGFWADGRVKIIRGAPGAHKLVSQMTRFEVSSAAQKDRADAAADIFHPDVYRVQAPYMEQTNFGVRQIGPDDAAISGVDPFRGEAPYTPDVIDTIFDNDPWN